MITTAPHFDAIAVLWPKSQMKVSPKRESFPQIKNQTNTKAIIITLQPQTNSRNTDEIWNNHASNDHFKFLTLHASQSEARIPFCFVFEVSHLRLFAGLVAHNRISCNIATRCCWSEIGEVFSRKLLQLLGLFICGRPEAQSVQHTHDTGGKVLRRR